MIFMITSMIDQEFSHVHPIGMKSPKNLASLIFTLALDSTGQIDWYKGKLTSKTGVVADKTDSIALNAVVHKNGIQGYFLDMMVSLDLDVPPAENVIRVIDPNLFVVSFDAPAFHIPMEADIDYLAICFVASRIAWECRSSLVLPVPSENEDLEALLMAVGINALSLGGSEVYKKSKELLGISSFWDVKENDLETCRSDFESEGTNG